MFTCVGGSICRLPEILTTSSEILCQHGGRTILTSSNHDLFINGKQILIETDVQQMVSGSCPFNPGHPSPCVSIEWSQGSQHTKNNGIRLLTKSSIGKCYNINRVFQGSAIIKSTQRKVISNG